MGSANDNDNSVIVVVGVQHGSLTTRWARLRVPPRFVQPPRRQNSQRSLVVVVVATMIGGV